MSSARPAIDRLDAQTEQTWMQQAAILAGRYACTIDVAVEHRVGEPRDALGRQTRGVRELGADVVADQATTS